ncbi:MAG: alpha-ketoglutarate-dependent dioxygenase AlkB [Flavobacterium sp.]|uniref:alpha-ketoglutarate-dependent dioxygenase AlkB n=1 Tax=Flavobacterium sp. TaxID=239 RepID=UPI00260C35DE|nr:alpha-ketoglutarate-dependent dioxygenase AlkB [Flavobacterium sp.]MDD5149682.1 alpha-ketoglutarate-dependent dioxygenase AlkB [Flavobacterium sp.]
MKVKELKKEIVLINNILIDFEILLNHLKTNIIWDNSIVARKTASFGIPYNYSNIHYDQNEIPNFLDELVKIVNSKNGFIPNNCLINFYFENKSKMGFHSDQIDILDKNTGIVIFSFGSSRILRFKSKNDSKMIYDILLENNSYFYMSQNTQTEWLHSILPDKNIKESERFSLTFRKITEK